MTLEQTQLDFGGSPTGVCTKRNLAVEPQDKPAALRFLPTSTSRGGGSGAAGALL